LKGASRQAQTARRVLVSGVARLSRKTRAMSTPATSVSWQRQVAAAVVRPFVRGPAESLRSAHGWQHPRPALGYLCQVSAGTRRGAAARGSRLDRVVLGGEEGGVQVVLPARGPDDGLRAQVLEPPQLGGGEREGHGTLGGAVVRRRCDGHGEGGAGALPGPSLLRGDGQGELALQLAIVIVGLRE